MTNYFPKLKRYNCTGAGIFLRLLYFPLVALPAILTLNSCSEDSTSIGSGLLPATDFKNIILNDTIVPRTYNIYRDSVISSTSTFLYLGGLHDPYFGDTYCDFVSQLRLVEAWPGGQPTVDSVTFFFTIAGAKGDLSYVPNVTLYEIKDQLYDDTTYYSKHQPTLGSFLGTYSLGQITKDTITTFTLKMPNSLGEYLLRDTIKLNQEGSTDDWRTYFKGLYVSLQPSGMPVAKKKGGIPSIPEMLVFDLTNGEFLIRVYYHTPLSEDLLYYDFTVSSKGARYGRYFHNLATADPTLSIKHVNDGVMDTMTCVQAFYGVGGKVYLNGLEKFKSMNISVNEARLTYHVILDGTYFTSTTVPSKIYLAYINADGTRSLVQDYTVSSSFYGGAFSSSASTYTFNIAAFVQAYLKGDVADPVLEMYLPDGEYLSTILNSVGSVNPPTFNFVYTRF